MPTRTKSILRQAAIAGVMLVLCACGGQEESSVTVVVTPPNAELFPGDPQSFTATVSGTTDTALTWAVDGVVGGNANTGTISGSGATITYRAPAAPGSHTLAATSKADPTKSATAKAVVQPLPAGVSVRLNPTSAVLTPRGTQSFAATVSGSTGSTAVTWAVDGIANGNTTVGTLSGSGNTMTYTAPSTLGNHTLRAISVTDTTKSTTAAISVQNSCVPAPTSTLERNVKNYGAKGDGGTDDTDAIQAVIDTVEGTGGTVVIPDGTYMINAIRNNGSRGLLVKSDMTIRLSSGAVLKAIPNTSSVYAILFISQANRVNILGGTVEGERSRHGGTVGESGMGISVASSQNVVIEGVTAKECWGDGFYIGGSSGCQGVTLCNVVGDHNRRSGLSAVSVDGLVIRNATFKNNRGTLPEAGVNLEPNAGETVANTQILGCTLASNGGNGIQVSVAASNKGTAFIRTVTMDGNTLTSNRTNGLSSDGGGGIEISATSGHKVTNNIFRTNNRCGLLLRDEADNITVTGNSITGTTGTPGDGIFVDRTISGFQITGNTAQNNVGYGIYVMSGAQGTLSGNTQSGNGTPP